MLAFSKQIPLKINRLKRTIQQNHGISWSEYLIICQILILYDKSEEFIKPRRLISELGMDRCWVYKKLNNLKLKGLIESNKNWREAMNLSLTGSAMILLSNIESDVRWDIS